MPLRLTVLVMLAAFGQYAAGQPLEVVPTFESAGLYLDAAVVDPGSTPPTVRYRPAGGDWRQALDMVYGPRERQYRSSIVNLSPGTDYEVEVAHSGRQSTARFSTWLETSQWPIGKVTRAMGATVVKDSGSPAGYHLVQGTTVNGGEYCVRIRADYVIVRGFQCVGQTDDVIVVPDNRHDILIEDNEIREWTGGNAIDMGSFPASTTHRIVIQRNWIHDPAWGDSDYQWNGSKGVRAIALWEEQGGNHVWRYNTVTATRRHMFSDAFGEGQNFSLSGYPGSDTDIYGNYISHCADDCLELEGGGMNVRVWNNYVGEYGVAIAVASISRGPVYIFRNVLGPANGLAKGRGMQSGAIKVGGNKCPICGPFHGMHFVFHNTFVNIPGYDGSRLTAGNHWGGQPRASMYRNNIIQVVDGGNALEDIPPCWSGSQANDLDYDLYWEKGKFRCRPQERHGIRAKPRFARFTPEPQPGGEAWYQLQPGFWGHDDGVRIPNFNDHYRGSGPDRGAHEAGAAAMCFGHAC